MNTKIFLIVLVVSFLVAESFQDRVSTSAACSKIGNYYAQGCSGLTAQLLGKPWKKAEAYRRGAYIGTKNNYHGVSPGELVGFPGHVAVYVGNQGCACKFVDVPGPNKNARCVKQGYWTEKVYKVNY